MTRKPMTFSVDDQPAHVPGKAKRGLAELKAVAAAHPSVFDSHKLRDGTPPAATAPRADNVERQQVGARVPKATYRQLKARAALTGKTVQALVEQAIDEFLAKSSG